MEYTRVTFQIPTTSMKSHLTPSERALNPNWLVQKSKLAYTIENQWVMYSGMAGSRDWAIHLGFVCPHLSVLLLCWFHSQAQWLWASPTQKARGVQQFLLIMLLGSVLTGNDDLLVSRSRKTLLLHFPLFCVTVFGSQACSHAWSWANYGAGVWDTLIDLGLIYVLWCDGCILSHLEWPDWTSFLGMSATVFPKEVSIWTGGFCKGDGPPQSEGASSNPPRPEWNIRIYPVASVSLQNSD